MWNAADALGSRRAWSPVLRKQSWLIGGLRAGEFQPWCRVPCLGSQTRSLTSSAAGEMRDPGESVFSNLVHMAFTTGL